MPDVPYLSQGNDDVGCVPACIKMIIEFYAKSFPDLPNPEMNALKKAMHYDDDGTPLDGVTDVNKILRGTAHQLEFRWDDFVSFSDIKDELDNGRPVIAWIKPNRATQISHSIVIKQTSQNDLKIKVNDPDPDELSEYDTTLFMKIWENSDRILIRAKVSDRDTQRQIGDYT